MIDRKKQQLITNYTNFIIIGWPGFNNSIYSTCGRSNEFL